jgi:S-adenosylmethionine decarboxylase
MNGTEWVVEAHGCDPVRLASVPALHTVFATIIAELDLHPVGEALWHQFPSPGGITGMQMLAESHLTVHTFPEHASLCLNLFCCTPRQAWSWDTRLRTLLDADHVTVRVFARDYVGVAVPGAS